MRLYSSRYCPQCYSPSMLESERHRRRYGDDVRVSCQDCGCSWIRYDRSQRRTYEALAAAIAGPQGEDPLGRLGADVAGGCSDIPPQLDIERNEAGRLP